ARELRLAAGRLPARLPAERLREHAPLQHAVAAALRDFRAAAQILHAAAGRGLELDRCALRASDLVQRLQRWHDAVWGNDAAVDATCDEIRDAAALERADDAAAAAEVPDAAAMRDDGSGTAAIAWADIGASHLSLRRTPLSIAAAFQRHLAGRPAARVFVSATLACGEDFGHFTRALGLDSAQCARWDSPFDYARRAALYVPQGLGDPSSAGFTERAVDAVWPLIRANRGRAFFLATTLRAVRAAADRLREHAQRDAAIDVLAQGDAARHELLARFAAGPPAVLIGSASFWEGVDVVGDALSIVAIDKLPFAPPDDPVVRARIDALRRGGGDPFSELQLPAAAVALKQGAGRLIRSETDRGVLVICDERIVRRGYGRQLLASLPPFARVRTIDDALTFLPDSACADEPAAELAR
ncbi:MAG TPA: ATP-dependent DNA helicase, partial [Burkholderiaceae bacterium]|nr:ATP-dependent DNA helicase [Burkholderiaceae bacterium]